jgi:hypothetical protein
MWSRSTWKWIGVALLCVCIVAACCWLEPVHGLHLVRIVRVWTHDLSVLLPTAAEDAADIQARERLRQLREIVKRQEENNAEIPDAQVEEMPIKSRINALMSRDLSIPSSTPSTSTPSSPSDLHEKERDDVVAVAAPPPAHVPAPALNAVSDHVAIKRRASVVSSRESEVRELLESMLRPCLFPKVRPPFLMNKASGRALELDCYSSALRLAVEINGEQHYVWPSSYFSTRAEFDGPGGQLERDALKRDLCKQAGITLLVVPFTVRRGAGIETYLRQLLAEHRPELQLHGDGAKESLLHQRNRTASET